jgi:hypothetical protein
MIGPRTVTARYVLGAIELGLIIGLLWVFRRLPVWVELGLDAGVLIAVVIMIWRRTRRRTVTDLGGPERANSTNPPRYRPPS